MQKKKKTIVEKKLQNEPLMQKSVDKVLR
jgi:hypothetical protein